MLTAATTVAVVTRLPITSDRFRAKVVSTLEERLDSEVELEGLTLRIFPRLHAEGIGLSVRHRGRMDVPPLFSAKKFIVDADLIGIWRRRVAHVKVEGLNIQIPPAKTMTRMERRRRRRERRRKRREPQLAQPPTRMPDW